MEFIATKGAPAAIGPYSQATKVGNMLFLSGQIPIDPATQDVAAGDIKALTRLVLSNIAAILAEAGFAKTDVAKATVFLTDLGNFAAMNEEYSAFFGEHKPARSTIQVAGLPKGVPVEIEVTCVKG